MELKSLEDWVVEKNFKSVPDVVDVASFGGPTREYQVRIDPDKLIAYGLSIGQVEQQLANNNANAGGSFIEAGLQQVNVREVGLVNNVRDIADTVIKTQNGTPLHISDIATVAQGPKIRLGQFGRAIRPRGRKDYRQRGRGFRDRAAAQGRGFGHDVLKGIHAKVEELNNFILPAGVKIVPFIDRSELVEFTTHTVLHNLTEGIILVIIILFLFLGNTRAALIVAVTIPFSLLFASICLSLRHIPANLLSLGALDFGMVVDGAVVMIENIVRHLHSQQSGNGERMSVGDQIRAAAHEVQRPVFYAITIIITAYIPIFTLQRVEGRLFKPMAWTVAFALLGALLFSIVVSPVLASFLFRRGAKEWRNPVMRHPDRALSQRRALGHSRALGRGIGGSAGAGRDGVSGDQRDYRLRVSSASGRRRAVGARNLRAQHRTDRGRARGESGSRDAGCVPGGDHCDQPGGTAGRWHRYHRLLQHRILRGSEAEGAVASDLSSEQGCAHRRHERAAGEDPRRDLEFFAAHRGQHGRGRQRREGPACHQDLRRRSADPGRQSGRRCVKVMHLVPGIEDLGVFRLLGQPNLNVEVDRQQAARFQINVADVQDAIQTAVGGNALTQVLQGEQRYDLVARYQAPYRDTREAIANIRLLSPSGERVSLAQLCKIEMKDGGSEIYREGNQRYVAVKYSVRGRDLGSTVEEAIDKGEQAGPIAARLSHQLGRRIREREARGGAPVHYRAAHGADHFRHPLHHVSSPSNGPPSSS